MKYLNFALLGVCLFCFACWIGNWSENSALRERLDQAEESLAHMRAEHELALSAASEAMKAREEIHEYQKQRMCEAERALGNNPDFCNQPLPDDLRMLWQANPVPDASLPAAGGVAGGH